MPESSPLLLQAADWQALWVSLRLAGLTALLLVGLTLPLAWWLREGPRRQPLGRAGRWLRQGVRAVVNLPLVLPPSVLGFYLLMALGAQGLIGQWTLAMGWGLLPFTFWGLLLASLLYSLPFACQPLLQAIESLGDEPLDMADVMGLSRLATLRHVLWPMLRPGAIAAFLMSFAHTLGEFGVVLMIGGNIPGQTQLVSVQLYELVEGQEWARAHQLALLLVGLSLVLLLAMQRHQRRLAAGGWRAAAKHAGDTP